MHVSVPAVLPVSRRASIPAFSEIRANAVAGLVAGVIALPLSIALAVAVGVPPIVGLYTAVFAGGAASIFGGSRFNITGPTAALVPLLSHVVLVHGAAALPMVGLMAGVLLLAMSRLKFGSLVRYMPGTVIIGFTAGIALSIIFGQVNTFPGRLGTDPKLRTLPRARRGTPSSTWAASAGRRRWSVWPRWRSFSFLHASCPGYPRLSSPLPSSPP